MVSLKWTRCVQILGIAATLAGVYLIPSCKISPTTAPSQNAPEPRFSTQVGVETTVTVSSSDQLAPSNTCAGETSPGNPYCCPGEDCCQDKGNCVWWAWKMARENWSVGLPNWETPRAG